MENQAKNYKTQPNTRQITALDRGKVPPQAVDLEEAVLGAMMIDKKGLNETIEILQEDFFYRPEHQAIFNAISTLFNESQPIDLLTVSNQLRKDGKLESIGGDYYLIGLTQKVSSSAHIEFHARVIQEKYIMRKLIEISSNIIDKAYDETTDIFDLLDESEGEMFKITDGSLKSSYEVSKSLVHQAIDQIISMSKKEGMSGIPSGFTEIDKITSGWQASDLVILAARPGMGKCLGKGTKVVMYDGTLRNVEDVKQGEFLMGDDSKPRKVLSIARGQEKMYWVRQNKGMDYRVNESHILSLKRSRNEGNHKKGEVLNITVKDYLEKSDKFKSNYKGYKVAVDFEEKEVTVPPYFLGLWLGDGHSYSSRITTTDDEIINYLEHLALDYNQELKVYTQENKVNNYAITKGSRGGALTDFSLQAELRALDLIENKHIPQNYLANSKQTRIELLAGLVDTDGYYDDKANCYEIVQKNPKLVEQIKFLCDSLGYRTSLKKKKASIKERDYETEVYRLRFYGNISEIPVRIEKKKARERISPVDWKVTGVQVEFDKVDDYYGFEIDGNRLFLLEDMTVTHNTAFVLSMAKNITVQKNIPVAVFSLEMSSVQLITRLIVGETGISSEKIKKGKLTDAEWKQLYTKVKGLENAPLYIDDTPALNVFDLRAKCRRLVSQHGVKMVIIDYLQLMTTRDKGSGNREQEISTISRNLKAIAKELNVPVIALSQLSRSVETRGGIKRPLLSDLRESGAIEQDADIVTFIYRPEYYKLDHWDDEEGTPCAGQAEFIIAKHRNGALENIRLRFIGSQAKFTDLVDENQFGGGPVVLESSMNDNESETSEQDFGFTSTPQDAFGLGAPDEYSNDFQSGMNEDEDNEVPF